MIDVSVIVPVYNTEAYIEETMKSVANQEMKNYEIIIVDDGSTDKSIEIAESVLKDGAIPYRIIRQANKSQASARNTGIKAASGAYVCFVDSDDIISPSHITAMYSLAEKNNLDIVCCKYEYTTIENRYGKIGEPGRGEPESGEHRGEIDQRIISDEEFTEAIITQKTSIHICCVLLKREFLLSNNLLFNERLRYGEDSEFFLQLAKVRKSVGLTNNASYKYMDRPGSTMKTITLDRGEAFIEELKKTCDRLGSNRAYGRWVLGFLHAFARCADYKDFKEIAGKIDRRLVLRALRTNKQLSVKGFALLLRIHPALAYIAVKMVG